MNTYSRVLSVLRKLSLSSLNACAVGLFLLILGIPGLSITPGAAVVRHFQHIQAPSDLSSSAALVDANSWVQFWVRPAPTPPPLPPLPAEGPRTATVRVYSGMPVQAFSKTQWADWRTFAASAEAKQVHLVEFETEVKIERLPGILPRWKVIDGMTPLELLVAREQAYQGQSEVKGVRYVQDLGVYEPKSTYSFARKLGVYIGYFGPLLADILSVLLVGYGLYAFVFHRIVRAPVMVAFIVVAVLGQAQPALVRLMSPKAFVQQLDAPLKGFGKSETKEKPGRQAPAKIKS